MRSVSKRKPLSLPPKNTNRRRMHNSQVCSEQCQTLATQESTGIAMNPTAKGLSTKRIQQFSKGLI